MPSLMRVIAGLGAALLYAGAAYGDIRPPMRRPLVIDPLLGESVCAGALQPPLSQAAAGDTPLGDLVLADLLGPRMGLGDTRRFKRWGELVREFELNGSAIDFSPLAPNRSQLLTRFELFRDRVEAHAFVPMFGIASDPDPKPWRLDESSYGTWVKRVGWAPEALSRSDLRIEDPKEAEAILTRANEQNGVIHPHELLRIKPRSDVVHIEQLVYRAQRESFVVSLFDLFSRSRRNRGLKRLLWWGGQPGFEWKSDQSLALYAATVPLDAAPQPQEADRDWARFVSFEAAIDMRPHSFRLTRRAYAERLLTHLRASLSSQDLFVFYGVSLDLLKRDGPINDAFCQLQPQSLSGGAPARSQAQAYQQIRVRLAEWLGAGESRTPRATSTEPLLSAANALDYLDAVTSTPTPPLQQPMRSGELSFAEIAEHDREGSPVRVPGALIFRRALRAELDPSGTRSVRDPWIVWLARVYATALMQMDEVTQRYSGLPELREMALARRVMSLRR